MLIGCILVLFNALNIISAISTCYPVNGQRYCLYSYDSHLSWDKARQFCARRNSKLPIITDEHIDRTFQQFISDNNIVSGSVAEQTGNYVGPWLDLHAGRVDSSDQWHWINGQPSALKRYIAATRNSRLWSASIGLSSYGPHKAYVTSNLSENVWSDALSYVCQYHIITPTETNCTSKWVRRPDVATDGSKKHHRTNTLEECQKACEFDPRCVAVDYHQPEVCWINANPYHSHFGSAYFEHYKLVSRCNITAETNCDSGIVYNSRCYKIHRERVNWFTAVNRCLTNNGSLASFDDNILKYFASTLLTEGRLWIGLIRSWWTWPDADDADVLFNKFDTTSSDPPRSPPNVTNSGYDCVVATTGYWRLSRCSNIQRVVCQSVGPLTTPATTMTSTSITTTSELLSHSTAVAGNETSSLSTMKLIPLIAGVVAAVVVVALIVVVVVVVASKRRRRSGQQPMRQTGDSSDTGQYESISSSTPNVVYAHINPAQESEPEYVDVR